MKRKAKNRIIVWIAICLITVGLLPCIAIGSDSTKGEILFKADQPDADGIFTVRMTVYNATFNAYQFALKYNAMTIVPVDSNGNPTVQFNSFATRLGKPGELSAIGTNLDTAIGLIEFAGYVTPGSVVTTGEMGGKPGYAVIGADGYEMYQFRFKLNGSGGIGLVLATKSSGGPYSKSLPEGGALFDAGVSPKIQIRFELPDSVGGSSIVIPGGIQEGDGVEGEEIITIERRLQNTLIFRIDSIVSADSGHRVYIDQENPKVRPYINEEGRTMVPIRFIAERLGASVDWDAGSGRVTISAGVRTVIMTVGSRSYTVNGVVHTMDTEPVIIKGWNRTLVPVRFISEALDWAVEWDPVNRMVLITEKTEPWQLDREIELQVTEIILESIFG